MPLKICPRCQTRYVVSNHSGDYVHQCNSGDNTLDEEDVLVIGDWEDYSGSGTVPSQEVMVQGIANDAWGTRAEIEGADITDDRSDRGTPTNNTRTRKHFEYIDGDEC